MAHDWSLFSAEAEKQWLLEEEGGEITFSETKGLEQFPKDKLELGKMIDK